MKVFIMPKFIFEQAIDGIEKSSKDVFYLSINNPDDEDKTPIREDSDTFKSMWFYDIDEDIYNEVKDFTYKTISDEQLDELYDFIMKNKDKKNFVVHCTAGVSRSGAVGEFVNDLFGIPYAEFRKQNPNIIPNTYIKKKLNEKCYQS